MEEGSNLIIRQYESADAVQGADWEFFGSKSVSKAGMVSVEKNSYGKELAGGKYVAAVLMKGADAVAYSNAVPVVLETEMEKPVLTVNGNVYEGDTKVSLAVSKTDLIPSGKGTINLYKADAEGKVEVWGELESVGSKSPVVSGDAVEIALTKTLTAGDILVPYIYYYDGDADRQYYYPGTAFTVKAKAEGDSISVSPEALTADTESITVSVNGYDSYKGGYVFVRLADKNNTDPDVAKSLKSQSFTGSGSYTFDVKGKLTPEKYVLVYLYKYDSDTDRTHYSDKVYIPIGGKVVKEPSVEITSSKILSTDKNLYVKADFDNALTGNLKLYTYRYGGAFDSANAGNVLLYSGAVTPSAYGSKITFTNDLTAGDKIVAVLTLTGGASEVVKISDAKTIQAPPQIIEPSAYIREEHVSEGDTKMETYLNFERNYYDSVSYVLYNYTGEELDESTAKIAAENSIYSPGQTTMGFRESVRPLKAGSKLMIKLTVVKNGVSKVVYSNVKTVEAAPDWATPTVSIDVAAVKVTDTTIPVTVTYDAGYTEMSDYYCNVTAYQFPSSYTDDEFEKKELHESQITQRIGQRDANKASKEHFTTINIPVKANTLEAGKRLIVKLRLPHPEWAGEEADYLSYSVPIIGAEEEIPAAKVLLFNLGADTVKGSKIRAILEEMGIAAVTVEKSQINQSVGYLAGYKGFVGNAEAFTGSGYTAEFMLMSGLSETQLDQFLAKMRAADAVIDHKATVTETNKQWSFKELIGEIEEEHEVMQAWLALKNAVKEAEALQEADYSAEKWAAFAKVLADAKEVSKVEATAEEYNNATKALQDAYKALTAKPESGGGSSSGGGGGGSHKPTVTIPDDVPTGLNGDDHYAYIVGYPDSTVRPQNGITRAEVATIFFRLLTDETRNANSTKSNSYSDVAAGAWYNHAVSTLSAMGIVKGDSHGKFNPNAPITRAEFAAIAARFDDKANTTAVDFSDIASHWAKNEISAAANNGWINGYTDGTFRPNNKITRAEAMTLVNRVLKRLPETAEDLHNDMIKWSDNSDTSAWYYLAVQEATNSHYYGIKENKYEKWSKLRETRDWTELEK